MSPLLGAVVDLSLETSSFQQLAARLVEASCRMANMACGVVLHRGEVVTAWKFGHDEARAHLATPRAELISAQRITLPLALEGGLLVLEGGTAVPEDTILQALQFIAGTLSIAGRHAGSELFSGGPVVTFRWKHTKGWPIETVSSNLAAEFGWKSCEMLGKPFAALVHAEDLERITREVDDALTAGVAHLVRHYRLQRADGVYRWVLDATRPVRASSGEVTHFDGYVFDDTPRVEAQTARKALETQLRHSQKLQAVGTLAAGIAHDFNNLLASILAHAELARRHAAPSPEDLDEIQQAAIRGREVVRQLLVFSRGEREEQSPLRVQAVVEESMGLLRAALPSTIQVEQRLDTKAPTVRGNATQLQQVVLNLAMNSMRAMPMGGTLTVAVDTVVFGEVRPSPTLRSGVHVRLRVRDTGVGMNSEVAARAFEPFFTTRAKGEGSGLGLSMVHGIVGAHSGAISLASSNVVPAFTEVTIWLPAAATLELPSAAVEVHPTVSRRLCIAVLDDEEVLARATRRLLMSLGHVATTHDSASLLRSFSDDVGAFDLVISDFTMPGLNGAQIVTELRRQGINVPFIIMTGHLNIDLPPVSRVALLNKPFGRDELVEVIARVLHH